MFFPSFGKYKRSLLLLLIAANLYISYRIRTSSSSSQTVTVTDTSEQDIEAIKRSIKLFKNRQLPALAHAKARPRQEFLEECLFKDHHLIFPAQKLVFMGMPRNAFSQAKLLHCNYHKRHLNDTSAFTQKLPFVSWTDEMSGPCTKVHAKMNAKKGSEVYSTDWTRVALIRDPYQRFMSAYLTVCFARIGTPEENNFCFGCGRDIPCFLARNQHYLKSVHVAMEKGRKETCLISDRPELAPQSWFLTQANNNFKIAMITEDPDKIGYHVRRNLPDLGLFDSAINSVAFSNPDGGSGKWTQKFQEQKLRLKDALMKNATLWRLFYDAYIIDYRLFAEYSTTWKKPSLCDQAVYVPKMGIR